MTRFIKLLMLLLACNCSVAANAEDITVMISGGFSAALDKLAPHYEAQTGDVIHIIHGPSMGNSPESIPHRLAAGQKADVVIMVGYALDKLQQAGKITPGSRTELADSRIGMVVRSGTAVPDISNVAALKATLLKARSVAYSDSASGLYVQSELFRKLGIENELHNKLDMIEKTPVARVVARGSDEVGFQQVSELLPVKGVEFVGKIPEQVQYVTRFAGAVVAGSEHQEHARQLLHYLSSQRAQPVVRETGLDTLNTKEETTP
ncbi:ABC transporter substrate-binding protein [Salmonella enterica subsp. enterica serovar Poona]|nr:ABC transporter substrate-binding protein [Salmonella enterica subsp. enterica serovar Poona]